MPIFVIVVALAAIIGIGGYFFRNTDDTIPAPIVETVATNTPSTPAVTNEEPVTPTAATTTATTTAVAGKNVFTDGSHAANASYIAPGQSNHAVAVSLTLKDDTVTDVSVVFSGDTVDASSNYQKKFTAAYKAEVIGKKLSAISLSRVGGASLTTGAFNAALTKITAEAKS